MSIDLLEKLTNDFNDKLIIDEMKSTYNQKKGLSKLIDESIEMVANGEFDAADYKSNILKINSSRSAKSLCNSITRYIYFIQEEIEHSFAKAYLTAICSGAYKWKSGVYSYVLSPDKLVKAMSDNHFSMNDEICHHVKNKSADQMIEIIKSSGKKLVLIRNKKNTHTYLVRVKDLIRLDTWHRNKNGRKFVDDASQIYWYER